MARPIRNNAEYFTHPANFRNDRRVKAIRAHCGLQGYAILMMMMEALTDAEFTQLSTDELEMELLAGDIGVSVTEIHSLLQIAEKIGLFSRNADGNLICDDLNRSLEQVFDKRNRSRKSEEERKNKVSVTEMPVSVAEIPQNKVKERDTIVSPKEKDIYPPELDTSVKKNGNGQMVKPDLPTLVEYMNKHGGNQKMAEAMFNFYSSKGWKIGKDPMVDWNRAASGWISRQNEDHPQADLTTKKLVY